MQAPNAPYGPALPPYAPPPMNAAAMSPPQMMPPPGVVRYGQPNQLRPMPQASSAPLWLAIIALVLGLMFVGTCAAMHAACS
jgi:hypothetical protein